MKKIVILSTVVVGLGLLLVLVPKQQDRLERGSATPDVILPGINGQTVETIRIDRPNKARITLTKAENEWRIEVPGEGTFPAESRNIEDLFKLMSESRVVKLISSNPEKFGTFDVDADRGIVVAFLAGGERKLGEIVIGKLAFNFRSNYVRIAGANEVYELGGDLRRLVDRDAGDWRDRTLIRIEPAQVNEIEFFNEYTEKPLTIRRSPDGPWGFHAPDDPVMDKNAAVVSEVNKLVNQFAVIIARSVADTASAADLASYGLEPPKATIKVTEASGKVTLIKFGMKSKDDTYPAMREGSSSVYFVPQWIYDTLTPSYTSLTVSGGPEETRKVPVSEIKKGLERRRK